ncbi:Uu.00g097450.m01.CDS01 [Anthostomella pinea]|uniref:Uu.00g097450.m01.CDS01 n=1 Tax=Anthostomella pinea TaxID=933095 RepID=A0AAI8YEY4_9PEZI|nr:Uu.00g097450.m01.CDS01 [Anthostomella pinea]
MVRTTQTTQCFYPSSPSKAELAVLGADQAASRNKQYLRTRNIRFDESWSNLRLQDVKNRTQRGLVPYMKCTNQELETFCHQCDETQPAKGSDESKEAYRARTIYHLERADDNIKFERFLDLLPELRNSIYEMTLTVTVAYQSDDNEEPLIVDPMACTEGSTDWKAALATMAVTRTCSQIYKEALPIFYAINTFSIGNDFAIYGYGVNRKHKSGEHFRGRVKKWLDSVVNRNIGHLRHLVFDLRNNSCSAPYGYCVMRVKLDFGAEDVAVMHMAYMNRQVFVQGCETCAAKGVAVEEIQALCESTEHSRPATINQQPATCNLIVYHHHHNNINDHSPVTHLDMLQFLSPVPNDTMKTRSSTRRCSGEDWLSYTMADSWKSMFDLQKDKVLPDNTMRDEETPNGIVSSTNTTPRSTLFESLPSNSTHGHTTPDENSPGGFSPGKDHSTRDSIDVEPMPSHTLMFDPAFPHNTCSPTTTESNFFVADDLILPIITTSMASDPLYLLSEPLMDWSNLTPAVAAPNDTVESHFDQYPPCTHDEASIRATKPGCSERPQAAYDNPYQRSAHRMGLPIPSLDFMNNNDPIQPVDCGTIHPSRTVKTGPEPAEKPAARRQNRQQSTSSTNTASNQPSSHIDKRKTQLERDRNKKAAAKCRRKAKVSEHELKERDRALSQQNRVLLAGIDQLKDEVLGLKHEILRHTGCSSQVIDAYIAKAARDLK